MSNLLQRLKAFVGFNPVAWIGHTQRMKRRIAEYLPAMTVGTGTPHVLVVVTPWQGTGIPWFSLVTGLLLSNAGATVTFVVDPYRVGGNAPRHDFILRCIRAVMGLLRQRHRVIDLATASSGPDRDGDTAMIQRLAGWNATWTLRGEMDTAGRPEFEARACAQLAEANRRIAATMDTVMADTLFVPGGIFATSGLWVEHARRSRIRVSSYDNGGFGRGMFAVDGLACHLDDIPRAFASIRALCLDNPDEDAAVISAATQEVSLRRGGTDAVGYQLGGARGDSLSHLTGGALLALNSSWDSAALGKHLVFADSVAWIVATVRHLLDTSEVPVIVRQHPAERLSFALTTDNYRQLLEQHFGTHPRLHFIAAADPVNSYDLLAVVGSVIVHTSTIGTEATVYGRPVVTASMPYFADLGFVWHAKDLPAYLGMLDDAAAGRLVVTDAMRDDALRCFYVTQICNWVPAVFNPEDFKQWSRVPIATLAADPAIRRLVEALLTDTPVPVLNHIAQFGE